MELALRVLTRREEFDVAVGLAVRHAVHLQHF